MDSTMICLPNVSLLWRGGVSCPVFWVKAPLLQAVTVKATLKPNKENAS